MKGLRALALAAAACALTAFFVLQLAPDAPDSLPGQAVLGALESPVPPAPAHAVASGETLTLSAAALEREPAVTIGLDLGVPSADGAPRPARVIAPDGRLLEQQAPVEASERRTASLTLDSEWLRPGRYIVEVKTTERSHFPLRRYAVVVE